MTAETTKFVSQELNLIDHGAISPTIDDTVSQELVGYLHSASNGAYNPSLGTASDPRYPSYKEFLSQIDQSVILQIRPEELSAGKYDDVDLTGEDDPNDYIVEDAKFFGSNNVDKVNLALEKMMMYNLLSSGFSIDKLFMPLPEDGTSWQLMPLGSFKEV